MNFKSLVEYISAIQDTLQAQAVNLALKKETHGFGMLQQD